MKNLLVAVCFVVAASSSAQITKSGPGYLFRMKHQAGSVFKFGVVSSLAGSGANGQPMTFTLPMIWKVVGVKAGVATIDTTVGPVSVGKNPMVNAVKNRIQLDTRGKVVGQGGAGQQVTPAFPEKAIKVGQSWQASAPVELPMQGEKKIQATYVFKGIKVVNGKQMAELAVTTGGQASGTGSMFLLVSDGSLFRSTLKMNLKMVAPDGIPTTYKVTADIKRQ